MAAVRSSTASAPKPDFVTGPPGVSWRVFDPVDCSEVVNAIRQQPVKTCAADPVPTSVLKQLADDISPFVATLINRSLTEGVFPVALKTASITPRLKKANMDDTDVQSFRPISNLSVVSKLIKRLVAKRLINYLTTNGMPSMFQSAYSSHHSVGTAVAKVLSDILLALDEGGLACLALLGVSAAFYTVDHEVPLQRLHITYGVNSVAHDWFRSYLIGRHQYVRVRASSRLRSSCVTVYRKDRFSARSYFCSTPLTSQHRSGVMDYMSTSMLTTLKYMNLVHRCQLINYSQAYRPALTMLLAGWRQINSS